MKAKIFLYISVFIFLGSCVKDSGNYDYQELTQISIDATTIPSTIVKKQQETLIINPEVKQGQDDSNLSYEWILKDNLNVPDPATGVFIDSLISTDKNLNFVLDIPARNYYLLLYVKDKTNGVTEYTVSDLIIQTIAPQGWMVLNGDDSGNDVSILYNPKINAGIADFSEDSVQHNIFSQNNDGKKLEGEGSLIFHARGGGGNYLYIFSKGATGGYRTSAADLKIVGDYASNFRDMPVSEINYQGFGTWSYNELLVNDGKVYFCSQNSPSTFIPFGVPSFGQDYVAAPYIGTHNRGYVYGAFYDSKNRRFLYLNYQHAVLEYVSPSGMAFDMTDVGKDMVYAEMGYSNNWYCVMQSPGDPGSKMLYVVNLSVFPSTSSGAKNHGAFLYDFSSADGMTDSKFFAFGNRGPVMYHATDDKIYSNAYSGDKTSELRYDVAANYPGYKITAMKLFNDNVANPVYYSKLLYVGIYNESTKDGKLLQFETNETDASFVSPEPEVYSGFKKISEMNYKWK